MGKKRQFRGKPNKYLTEDDKKNELFHHYYQKQFNWTDDEINQFYSTMLSELPATFRVTGFREHSKEVQWLIKNKFLEQLIDEKKDENGEVVERGPLAKALSWYPNEMAWQLNASKMEIRKNPDLKRLHKFLISETDCGFISRQEAVSMLPPLLLDIEPHHKVLDLCAAPGSKTAQLLEMLHAGTSAVPTGVVVANDIDAKRCYMMVHQLQRLQSPCVVVVRQDAAIFPRMRLANGEHMLFDRILADVPCSGDGTLRKNPDLWPRWSPLLGVNEHFVQVKILRRSLEMLAVGGRMVYSTCSLNPVEDEAVVAALLGECAGAVRLVDIAGRLPGLEAQPGVSSWGVMMRDRTWCTAPQDVPEHQRRSMRASLFPPAAVGDLHLERCRRVLPQAQNTGGFFVALLEKVAVLPWMRGGRKVVVAAEEAGDSEESTGAKAEAEEISENKAEAEEITENKAEAEEISDTRVDEVCSSENNENSARNGGGGPPKKKARVYKEDHFFYIEDDDVNWLKLKEYYDLDSRFPHRQLMYRNAEGKRRNYYFTNDLVKQLVQRNYDSGISFVNLGVKVFGLSEDKGFQGYRVLQEGLEIVEPHVGAQRRRLRLSERADLVTLLSYDVPLASAFSAAVQAEFARVPLGPVVFEYCPPAPEARDTGDCAMPRIRLVLAGWRGFSSLRHYVGVHERSHLLRLCGEEPAEVAVAPRWGEAEVAVEAGMEVDAEAPL